MIYTFMNINHSIKHIINDLQKIKPHTNKHTTTTTTTTTTQTKA